MELSQIDKDLMGTTTLGVDDVVFYNVRKLPIDIYGLLDPHNTADECFRRIPDEVAKNTSEKVVGLYTRTAGGRIRFSTDSSYVAINVTLNSPSKNIGIVPFMTVIACDLYEDFPETGTSKYRGPLKPDKVGDGKYDAIVDFGSRKKRYFTINLPHYGSPAQIYLGLQEGSSIGEGMKYTNTRPVVFYGSSITQGACASRPGTTYQNMLSRRFGLDYTNLGFSGSALAEDAIVDYMATLDMCCFVADYDHNATTAVLEKTHYKLYQKIRAAHPDIPYIMISRPDFDCKMKYAESIIRRDTIINSFRQAFASGDKLVYFIDGASIFNGEYEDCCTVDTVHPNDLGFMLMAEKIGGIFKRAMSDGATFK